MGNLYPQDSMSKTEKSFSKVKLKPGTHEITLENDYGKKWKARITFPRAIDASKENTLIIALHWAGDFGTYKEFHNCLVFPALNDLNAIIISPEAERQLWSTSNNEEKILAIIAYSQKYWNVNHEKIAVTGYSNGGNGSWYFAEHHPELLSAAIPMASSYSINKKIEIPLYVIHGARDELFDIAKTTKYVRQTVEAGSGLTFVVNARLSHYNGCSYIDELKKAGEWLKGLWKEK